MLREDVDNLRPHKGNLSRFLPLYLISIMLQPWNDPVDHNVSSSTITSVSSALHDI